MQNYLIQNFGSKLPKQGPGPPSLVCPRSVAVQSAAHLRGSEDAGGGTWLCTEPTAPAPACTAHSRELKKKEVRVMRMRPAAHCLPPYHALTRGRRPLVPPEKKDKRYKTTTPRCATSGCPRARLVGSDPAPRHHHRPPDSSRESPSLPLA